MYAEAGASPKAPFEFVAVAVFDWLKANSRPFVRTNPACLSLRAELLWAATAI